MLKLASNNYKRDLSRLSRAVFGALELKGKLSAEVEFVTEDEIRELNRGFRGKDSVTDVLSFPSLNLKAGEVPLPESYPLELDENGSLFLGSIAVSDDTAKAQAAEYGHSETREICYLVCHGLLHLLGYDHEQEEEKKEMRGKEEEIMDKLSLTRENT